MDFLRETADKTGGRAKISDVCKSIAVFLSKQAFQKATNLLVRFGLRTWVEKDAEQKIQELCSGVVHLPSLARHPYVTFTSKGKIAANCEQYLYFLAHYLLVIFAYDQRKQITVSLELVLPVLNLLWMVWDILLTHEERELCFECLWVTDLSLKYIGSKLPLPVAYGVSWRSATLALICRPLRLTRQNTFLFHHRQYTAMLAIIILGNKVAIDFPEVHVRNIFVEICLPFLASFFLSYSFFDISYLCQRVTENAKHDMNPENEISFTFCCRIRSR